MLAVQRPFFVGLVIIWFGLLFISRGHQGPRSEVGKSVHAAEPKQVPALYSSIEASSGKELPNTRAASGERIRGSLNAPFEGKPVAPVDFSWDFICEPSALFAIEGKVTITNQGTSGDITVRLSGREGFSLLSAVEFTATAIPQGNSVEIPVAGRADLLGNHGKLVIVATHVVQGTERIRVMSIDFAPQSRPPTPLPEGGSIITDDQGEKILLQPASRR